MKFNITKEIENSILSKELSKENSTDISKFNTKELSFIDKNESNEIITKDKSIELINKNEKKQDNSYLKIEKTVQKLPYQYYSNFDFNKNNENDVSNSKKMDKLIMLNDIISNKNELV